MEKTDKFSKIISIINNDYLEISNYKLIERGINSNVFILTHKNNISILKIYLNRKKDFQKRQLREYKFLNMLQERNFNKSPRLLINNRNLNFIVISHLKGKKVVKPNFYHLSKIGEFINLINTGNIDKYNNSIPYASEAFFNSVDIFDNIHSKLNESIFKLGFYKKDENYDILKSFFFKMKNELIKFKRINLEQLKHNEIITKEKFLSQSDIGFHNILEDNKELYFFDFEHSGWDNPIKTISDIILQPESPFTFKKDLNFYFDIAKVLKLKNGWQKKIKNFLTLYKLRWILIILNKYFLIEPNIKKVEKNLIIKKVFSYELKAREFISNI